MAPKKKKKKRKSKKRKRGRRKGEEEEDSQRVRKCRSKRKTRINEEKLAGKAKVTTPEQQLQSSWSSSKTR